MAGEIGTYTIPEDKYLLVSDSNEVGGQYDSKKLQQSELVEIAQDKLFKKHFDMPRYLTINQYKAYKDLLEEQYTVWKNLFDKIKNQSQSGKFSVEDGQVILIDCEEFDDYNSRRSTRMTPIEYLREHWDVPSDYTITQLSNCMLRGVTYIDKEDSTPIKKSGNIRVGLTKSNIPTHMHHSSVTVGGNIDSMQGGNEQQNRLLKDSLRYDMFYNDSFSTGVDKNELDGTVDTFSVDQSGTNDATDAGEAKILHNNMPTYRKFYAFAVLKNTN